MDELSSGLSVFHFDGYDVAVDADGVSSITVPEEPVPEEPGRDKPSGLIPRVIDWWKNAKVKPYVKVIDMNDPTGELSKDPFHDTEKPKPGVVIGVEVDF